MTAHGTANTGKWLIPYTTCEQPAFRVVCFPHAGGSASYYPWLRPAVPSGAELLCVQYPGRLERRREAPIVRFEEMTEAVLDVLSALPPRPLVLFGHSMGSLIAFETARGLERRGSEVLGLIVSGRRAPSVRPPDRAGRDVGFAETIAETRALGGIDPALLRDPEVLELILPVLRADYRLSETYRPEPGGTVSCPMTVLTGDADPRVDRAEAEVWSVHTTGDFVLHEVAGGHFFFNEDRSTVLEHVRNALAALHPSPVRS
ncbi:alpha/beta fold hydrolase [Streptomyces sp. SL13]|uniref:Alpha/beta fold hydrolase n=1 Tax=Streptantibioticus silvisoli TaxID=2705255 RepID=A0AA90H1S7_9ACTN|nr:alpha/beta fold hydrolase [Streptantibioticus silvisoli]MDI5968597.1 alpha/beta fold hydrolase [Streptantibioticus silvisoli]